MVTAKCDLVSVILLKPAQLRQRTNAHVVVIGPQSGELRHGMIVSREFDLQVIRIADVQKPTFALPDGDAAMAFRVAEEWNQEDIAP